MKIFKEINIRKTFLISLSAISSVIFFLIGLCILDYGHVHEDAYILLTYVKNIIHGNGIVYYPAGPHTEGVTDFLWMIILVLISLLKVDPAVSYLIASSIGLFIIVAVLLNNYLDEKITFNKSLIAILISFLVVISPFSTAALGGFSTLLYVSFVALLLEFYLHGTEIQILKIPLLALILVLIRPEGIFIGLTFTIITAIDIRYKIIINRFIKYCSIAAIGGILYFIWRWNYFGEFLPLPFYVKSDDFSRLIGLEGDISWIKENKFLLMIFVLSIPIFQSKFNKFIKLLIPFFLLFQFLLIIEQTQNIALRYHAPLTFLLMIVFVIFLKEQDKNQNRLVAFVISFVLIGFIGNTFYRTFNYQYKILKNHDYINYFPYLLKKSGLEPNLVALTEAGRMAYWTNYKIIDLVGLNNAFCATKDIDVNYLQLLNPDIIFIHTANTLIDWTEKGNYFTVSINEVMDRLKPEYSGNHAQHYSKVEWADIIVYKYLWNNQNDYEIYFVKFYDEFDHMYAIKRNGNVPPEKFKSILEKSFMEQNRKSYFEIKSLSNYK